MIVFKRGTWAALKGTTPIGGQSMPISVEGANLLWKKAQKNEKKNKISEVMNRIIPQRKPEITKVECKPWKVLSRVMSRHHWKVVKIIEIIPKDIRLGSFKENHLVTPVTRTRAAKAAEIGQGLWSTIWNEWLFLIIIAKFYKLMVYDFSRIKCGKDSKYISLNNRHCAL